MAVRSAPARDMARLVTAAQASGLGYIQVWRLAVSGTVRAEQRGSRWYVSLADLERYLRTAEARG